MLSNGFGLNPVASLCNIKLGSIFDDFSKFLNFFSELVFSLSQKSIKGSTRVTHIAKTHTLREWSRNGAESRLRKK